MSNQGLAEMQGWRPAGEAGGHEAGVWGKPQLGDKSSRKSNITNKKSSVGTLNTSQHRP